MFDGALRPIASRALAPAARAMERVAPGRMTVAALLLGLVAGGAAAAGAFGAALGLWLVNRVLDGLDGEVARRTSRQSDRGGYVDLVADVAVYAALTLGVAAGAAGSLGGQVHADPTTVWTATAGLLASYYLNLATLTVLAALFAKRPATAPSRASTSIHMAPGLVEGAETIVLISVMLLLPAHLPTILAVGTVLVLVTAVQRVAWAWPRLAAPP